MVTTSSWLSERALKRALASRSKRKSIGMLTSSVPSPDMANMGLSLIDEEGTLSRTIPPLAPSA